MVDGLNDLLIIGGATTVIDAEAVLPVPPFEALTVPLVLFFTPAVAPVTVTVITQLPPDARLPPLKLIWLGVVVVTVPLHCDEVLVATVNPAGSVSVNVTPVNAVVVFGFVTVKLNTLVPLSGIVAASNDFEIDGGPTTVNVAVFEVAPAPLSLELIAPVVLFHTPVVAPVTVTEKLQLPLDTSVPPVNVIVLGAVVDSVPPHVEVGPEVGTVIPDGSVSVKLIPVRFCEAFGLVIVKVKLVVALSSTLDAPNDLETVGAAATVNDAEAALPTPPLAEPTLVVMLFLTPAVVPVTVTLKLQLALAAREPPLKKI